MTTSLGYAISNSNPPVSGSELIEGMSFVAIDVETANAQRGSICAIGATLVRNGVIISTHSWLTRPPKGMDEFNGFNISLHGITPSMVANQPPFAERLADLMALANELPLVSHNAAFDMGVLRDACTATGQVWPTIEYACSLVIARRALDLISYRLPMVAAECGVELMDHHEAGADSLACAHIVLEIARRMDVRSVVDLCQSLRILAGRLEAIAWRGCHGAPPSAAACQLPEVAVDADPEHPLYGQVVVFTGALSIRRKDAWDAVAACGSIVEKGVTKRTTMLVIGDEFTGDDPAEFYTGKADKAVKLRSKGHRIEVLTEGDLLDLLAETRTSGIREAL